MFPLRRAALRLLSSPTTSLVSKSRTISTFSSSPLRVSNKTTSLLFQRRWASNEVEAQKDEVPVSKLQPTGPEEVENAISNDNATPSTNATESVETATTSNDASMSDPPAMAETANLTEATEETLPAAEDPADIQPESFFQSDRGARVDRNAGIRDSSPKKTLYVGNLFFDVTEDDLTKELSRFGTIQSIRLIRDARGLSKGFGYIAFENVEQATKAIAGLNQQLFEGRRLSVQYAAQDAPTRSGTFRQEQKKNPPSKTLFIGNMSWEMTDRDLNSLFRGIKNVIDVRVAIDRRTGQPRGFAHADFIDVKSAMEAEKVLQGKETYGRKLKVDFSYASSVSPRNNARDEGQDRRDRGGYERRSSGGTSNRNEEYQDREANQGNY